MRTTIRGELTQFSFPAQEFLRLSLRGGLLTTFAANERHQEKGIMLFEVGKVYLPREGELPNEREILAGIMGGARSEKSWSADKGSFDFFHAKGILETMFHRLGIKVGFEATDDALMLPGRTAGLQLEGTVVGVIGELHPDVATDFDISSEPVCLFEIEVEKLLPFAERPRTFRSIPRYPSTDRDIALIVDVGLPAQRIQDIIRGYPQVSAVTVFDVYQGEQVPQGKKSLAFALRYQSLERTLTDEEVDKLQEKMLARLQKELGAVLRR